MHREPSAPRHAAFPAWGKVAPSVPVLVAVALALLLVLSSLAAAFPERTLAATRLAARCDGVALRAKPSTSAKVLKRLPVGATVSATARVSGSRWTSTCGGSSSGSTWWRITSINGKSVRSLYGRSYVYAATGVFKASSTTSLAAQCKGMPLRARTSTAATVKARLAKATKVGAIGWISGGSWTSSCSGKSVSGSTWWVVTSIGGKSVKSLYGVSMLFATRTALAVPQIAAPVATPTPTPTPTPPPSPSASPDLYIEGIDVSHYQGTIDWTKVAAAGKRFAFIKATDGFDLTWVDSTFTRNRAAAKANGLLVGAYHFADPDATAGDAVAEADRFVDIAAPVKGELLPVLDLEANTSLTSTQLITWVKAFLGRVYERTGIRAAIYVSPAYWSSTKRMNNSAWFAANGYTVLWIAHWTSAAQPTVPAGNWGGKSWTFWQYTSSGSVPGITGNVDLDRYHYGDFTPVLVP